MNVCATMLITVVLIVIGRVPSAAQQSHALAEPSRPAWMQTVPELQVSATIEAKGRPLEAVLSAISQRSGVELSASRDIRNQRISLFVTKQPLHKIMERLLDVFGHGVLPNMGYEWLRIVEKSKLPRYVLQRNGRGVEAEAAELDYTQAKVLRWLRDARAYVQLPANRRKQFKTDNALLQAAAKDGADIANDTDLLIYKAVGLLTDADLTALMQNGRVDLPQLALSEAAIDWLRRPSPAPPNTVAASNSGPPALPELRLETDQNEVLQGVSTLVMRFRAGFPLSSPSTATIDTLNSLNDLFSQDALEAQQQQEAGSVVDLLAHEPVSTERTPFSSFSEAIRLLAREAKISIYAETFYKSYQALPCTKGKPEYLLSRLCIAFGCKWVKVGGDYLVCSRSWARDRVADVPQALIDKWMSARKRQGRLELSDLLEMVKLSDLQLTLAGRLFNISGPLIGVNRSSLRLLSPLNPSAMQEAFTPQGTLLPEATLSPEELRRVFRGKSVLGPIRVTLLRGNDLVDVTFTDQNGTTAGGVAYLGKKPAPNQLFQEQPTGFDDSSKPIFSRYAP